MATPHSDNRRNLFRLWIPALGMFAVVGAMLGTSLTSGDPAQFVPPACGLAFAGLVFASLRGLQKLRFARALRRADPSPYLRSFAASMDPVPQGSLLAAAHVTTLLALYGRFEEAEQALAAVPSRLATPLLEAQQLTARAALAYARGEVAEGLGHAVAAACLATTDSWAPGARMRELGFRNWRNLGLALSGRGTEATERDLRTAFARLPLLGRLQAAWGLAALAKRNGNEARFRAMQSFIESRAPHWAPVLKSLHAA